MGAIVFTIIVITLERERDLKEASFSYHSLVLSISDKDVFLFSFISKPFKLNIDSAL